MKLVNIHALVLLLSISSIDFGGYALQAQSLTLQQCTDAALSQNKGLEASRNDLELYPLMQEEAKANRWPKVNVSADYKYFTNLPYQLLPLSVFNGPEGEFREAQFGVPHNLGASVQLTVPIYNPAIKTGIKGTEIAAEMGQLQVAKSEELLILEVANLYYNAQVLQYQIGFVDSNLTNANRLLANMQLLREQGLAKGTDLGKVELQQAQLQWQRTQLTAKLEQVLNGLKVAMGQSLDTPLSVSEEISAPTEEVYPVSSPVSIRMLQVQNRLLSNERDLLNKSKLPTLSFVANYGLTGFGYSGEPDPFFKVFPLGFVGAQASYPLWNRTTRFRIDQKAVQITSNRLQLEQLHAQTELQLANAHLQRNAAQAGIPSAQQQIDLATSVYQQTRLQQEQGTATITEVLLADTALREAQNNYLNALIDYLRADLELKQASGTIKN